MGEALQFRMTYLALPRIHRIAYSLAAAYRYMPTIKLTSRLFVDVPCVPGRSVKAREKSWS